MNNKIGHIQRIDNTTLILIQPTIWTKYWLLIWKEYRHCVRWINLCWILGYLLVSLNVYTSHTVLHCCSIFWDKKLYYSRSWSWKQSFFSWSVATERLGGIFFQKGYCVVQFRFQKLFLMTWVVLTNYIPVTNACFLKMSYINCSPSGFCLF